MNKSTNLPLRPATASDEAAIHRLVRIGKINPMGIHWERFFVIESPNGDVIACGQNKPHRDGSTELASIVVDPEWRGQGLAGRIIEHLKQSHSGVLFLMCRSSIGPMYEKFGFRAVDDEEMPRYFRRVKGFANVAGKLFEMPVMIMVRDAVSTETIP